MNRYLNIFALFSLLCFSGCVSISPDPRFVGVFTAENSETLAFMSDGRVFHTQMVDGKEERHFLGYYVSSKNDPHHLGFCAPDTSSFLGTSFQANEDFSTVTADWSNYRKPKDAWQITYRKNPKAN